MEIYIDMQNKVGNVVVAIMGDQKVGKTTLACSFPKPVLVDLERGAEYIKVPKLRAIDLMEANKVRLTDVLSEFRGWLLNHKGVYETVVIDTADAMWELLSAPERTTGGQLPVNKYTKLYIDYINAIQGIRETGVDVVLTSHIKHEKNEEGAIIKTDFALPQGMAKKMGGYVGEIFYLSVGTQDIIENKKTITKDCRVLLTKPVNHPRFGNIPAGDRSGNLPKLIYDATYKDLLPMKEPPKGLFDVDNEEPEQKPAKPEVSKGDANAEPPDDFQLK